MTGELEFIKYTQRVSKLKPDRHSSDPSAMVWHTDHEVREWSLGRGPCGRHVVSLKASVCPDYLEIRQRCSDQPEGQYDTFLVPIGQITSTIQLFSKRAFN